MDHFFNVLIVKDKTEDEMEAKRQRRGLYWEANMQIKVHMNNIVINVERDDHEKAQLSWLKAKESYQQAKKKYGIYLMDLYAQEVMEGCGNNSYYMYYCMAKGIKYNEIEDWTFNPVVEVNEETLAQIMAGLNPFETKKECFVDDENHLTSMDNDIAEKHELHIMLSLCQHNPQQYKNYKQCGNEGDNTDSKIEEKEFES